MIYIFTSSHLLILQLGTLCRISSCMMKDSMQPTFVVIYSIKKTGVHGLVSKALINFVHCVYGMQYVANLSLSNEVSSKTIPILVMFICGTSAFPSSFHNNFYLVFPFLKFSLQDKIIQVASTMIQTYLSISIVRFGL